MTFQNSVQKFFSVIASIRLLVKIAHQFHQTFEFWGFKESSGRKCFYFPFKPQNSQFQEFLSGCFKFIGKRLMSLFFITIVKYNCRLHLKKEFIGGWNKTCRYSLLQR